MDSFLHIVSGMGYLGVFILMTVESSFIPFPSEIVVPPAAYLAAQGEMNVFFVVFFAVLGSLAGALINYFIAYFLGRPLVYSIVEQKWARYFLLTKRGIERAEEYFLKYGELSTFIGRLIPAVRQLISLPAGFSRMKIVSFIIFTALGSFVWVSILAALGYFVGSDISGFSTIYKFVIIGILFIFAVYLFFYLQRRKRR